MNSRMRLVFMSLTLLTSQCPLVRTYCSTFQLHSIIFLKCHYSHLFQLLQADDHPAHGVKCPVHHLLVNAPRLPLLLATLKLLLSLLLCQHPGGFHASRLTQPGKCSLCLWIYKLDVPSTTRGSKVKLLDVLPNDVRTHCTVPVSQTVCCDKLNDTSTRVSLIQCYYFIGFCEICKTKCTVKFIL